MGTALALPVLSPTALDALSVGATPCGDSPLLRPIPGTLNQQEFDAVTVLAEMILPRTDTPGALDAGTPAFIDRIVGEWYDADEAQRFREGIARLDASAMDAFDKTFAALEPRERQQIVDDLDQELSEIVSAATEDPETNEPYTGPSPADHFFYQMKWLTLTGYFTSEVGMRQGLGYKIVPGGFQGCILRDA